VSVLRTTKTVFPQHALVETYFKLSEAYEAHERALSWETSPRAWLANVRAIEMEKGLIPVPASSGFPVDVLRGARLNELLELRAEKKMSSWNISVKTPPKWQKCESFRGNGLRSRRQERAMDRMDQPRTSVDERMLSGRRAVMIV